MLAGGNISSGGGAAAYCTTWKCASRILDSGRSCKRGRMPEPKNHHGGGSKWTRRWQNVTWLNMRQSRWQGPTRDCVMEWDNRREDPSMFLENHFGDCLEVFPVKPVGSRRRSCCLLVHWGAWKPLGRTSDRRMPRCTAHSGSRAVQPIGDRQRIRTGTKSFADVLSLHHMAPP